MSEFRTIPYQRNRVSDAEMIESACRVRETLALRRAVREFSSDPVPMEVIDHALAAAASAPSGASQQPRTFVVVTGPDVKRRIRIAAEEEERENYGGRMTPEWLAALAPPQTDWKKEFLEIAPVLIVVFKQDYGWGEGGRKVTHYYVNVKRFARAEMRVPTRDGA